MTEARALKLSSPSAGEPVIYEWPLTKTESYDAAGEIIESIRFVSEEHKELNVVMEKVVKISKTDTRSYDAMRQLCDNFSRAADTIRQLWKHATRPDNPNQAHASPRLLKHVVQQCYNRSVADPSKLNHYYNAFSPEVPFSHLFPSSYWLTRVGADVRGDVVRDGGEGGGGAGAREEGRLPGPRLRRRPGRPLHGRRHRLPQGHRHREGRRSRCLRSGTHPPPCRPCPPVATRPPSCRRCRRSSPGG